MKINTPLLQLDFRSFIAFVRSDLPSQTQILNEHGILVDYDSENDFFINLYFIKGFFVEQFFSKSQNKVIQNIPYKQGYRTRSYVEVKETIVAKKKTMFSVAA